MSRSLRPLLVPLLASALFGCAGSSPTATSAEDGLKLGAAPTLPSVEQIGEPLAHVNGLPVGTKEFDALAARKGRDEALDPAARQEIIDRLVEEKLLYLAALSKGIDKDPKIQKMMVNTLLKDEVYSSVRTTDISEDDLKLYFEAHKDDFIVPEKVQVKRILIEPERAAGKSAAEADAAAWSAAEKKAAGLRTELVDLKVDFRKLAQDHSTDPYARRGGDLGFVTSSGKPGVPPEVITAAFALEKGAISEPFRTEQGWNIVFVPNRRDRVERTFEQMRGSVLRKVKSDRYKSLYEGFVAGLRAEATVTVDAAKLAAHVVTAPAGGGLTLPDGAPEPDESLGEPEPSGHEQ